jgi:hypothetical protein
MMPYGWRIPATEHDLSPVHSRFYGFIHLYCIVCFPIPRRLTKNPRVDFISKRVEEIKGKKGEVSKLALSASQQLETLKQTSTSLNRAMLDAYRDELGDRRWDEATASYVRVLHPEEKRLVADMERALNRCSETLDKVVAAYAAHLEDLANKSLTFNTPDEEARLATVMQTKEEYKDVRTAYSDAMIDADAHLSTGGDPSPSLQQKVDDAKKTYEDMSERLCDDALKYEHIYREELSQRVAAHFTAEQRLLRGVATSMRDFYPYTTGLTLDWQEMRSARRVALQNRDRDDVELSGHLESSLPRAPSLGAERPRSLSGDGDGNPFDAVGDGREVRSKSGSGGLADSASSTLASATTAAASAAASVGAAVRSKSKGLSSSLASYAPAMAARGASAKARGGASGDRWDNVKL